MKILKKINIGLVLAIITILAVVIYCVNLESSRKSAKQDIKKVCEEFIDLSDKYSKLPEEYQNVGGDLKQVNLDVYYSQLETELKEKMKNDAVVKIEKSVLEEKLKKQLYDLSKITIDVNTEITKISSYKFNGDQVTVTFNTKVTTKQKYLDDENKISEKINETNYEDDSIVLQQIDGKWKIVLADLGYISDIYGGDFIG